MSKKKIISLCLVVCLLATAIGGTLAYFTDTDSEKNTFTVGNVDIEVSETNKVNGVEITGNAFENVMPGTEITKTAVVTNNSSEVAYVRVVVHMDRQEDLYKKLLGLKKEDGSFKYSASDIFKGWDFTFEEVNGMRYTSTRTPGTANGVTLIAVDEAIHSNGGGTVLMSGDNYFQTEYESGEKTASGVLIEEEGRVIIYTDNKWQGEDRDWYTNPGKYAYYQDLVGLNKESAVAWIYYLKMEPNSSYTLFEGINIPGDFTTASEMAFFNGLEINVCADAIQSTGFTDAKAAFEALNEAHPLSAWNLGER